MKVITNNFKVNERFKDKCEIEYYEDSSFVEILIKVRDYVQNGYRLLTHPLSGSIKPDETPFKSVMIEKYHSTDFDSVNIISIAIEKSEVMMKESKVKEYTDKLIDDFSEIDYGLIRSGLESHFTFKK